MSSSSAAPLFTLPSLPYDYKALQPFYSEAQLRLHHQKHMQVYTDKLNAALKSLSERDESSAKLVSQGIDFLLSHLSQISDEKLRNAVRNNGGGYVNHDLFFKLLTPPRFGGDEKAIVPTPVGASAELIERTFGSFKSFSTTFTDSAMNVFGSGWTWLFLTPAGQLQIVNTPNQDTPINQDGDAFPLLVFDIWEHAYYKDYENRRVEYLEKLWNIINWAHVEERYQNWLKKKSAKL